LRLSAPVIRLLVAAGADRADRINLANWGDARDRIENSNSPKAGAAVPQGAAASITCTYKKFA
jgi:hypothetical protein